MRIMAKTKVDAHKHSDTRTNIPTEELREFMAEQERAPYKVLYPRDPTLDPQLVWKGKDEQDAADLEVPAVPIYIQEKIHPQALIEALRAEHAKTAEPQSDLFADFNGLASFEQAIEFYQHEQHWSNRMILGDSLLVMNSLAEKEALRGKVQMIYLDPPYGIKFGSNWQVSTRKREVKDGKAEDASREPEVVKAFRDTWALGIHSYLAYLRDRLVVARDLLTESGSLFVQIGDENVHLVRSLMDEAFGADNYVSTISFATTSGFQTNELARAGDYILWYAKNKSAGVKYRSLFEAATRDVGEGGYRWVVDGYGFKRGLNVREVRGEEDFPTSCRLYKPDNILSQGAASQPQPFDFQNKSYLPNANSHWKAQYPQGMHRLAKADRIHVAKNSIQYVRFADDFVLKARSNLWTDTLTGQYTDDKLYVVQTNTKVIERCMLMTTDPGDLVLDPTCGSGTTAFVAESWGRRWITCDTSRVALALARTRLMAGKFPYYLLTDSLDGMKKEAEVSGKSPSDFKVGNDVRRGFVFKRVPHITLKAIANNPEIDAIHETWQPKLDAALAALNKSAKQKLQEWEVPRDADAKWSKETIAAHTDWWELRRQRQADIDASIARNADFETLVDQPYDDNKRVRVAGPFTVESLSPHRVLPADANQDGNVSESEARSHSDFVAMLIDNLRKAGVQNTKKGERLKFDRLETFAGTWLQASGDFTDADSKVRSVKVAFGPEFGTVGDDLLKEAAKEAMQGIGCDLLLVCGFAFEAGVNEEARNYGRLTVLPVKMNPDLAMGDDLLKKTGSGNLFMVFGEPDVEIKQQDGMMTVEVKGVDVYDPTTGVIRSSSTDDIACWFIDTAYNGESFFVRHAYFTGADKPFEKLQKSLKADIDADVWGTLYSTKSRAFPIPKDKSGKAGKIAIKVINHYGDEVMKVFAL
jgi:adenine-specific DNA-methyltransferase